jgi:hypothetical protein
MSKIHTAHLTYTVHNEAPRLQKQIAVGHCPLHEGILFSQCFNRFAFNSAWICEFSSAGTYQYLPGACPLRRIPRSGLNPWSLRTRFNRVFQKVLAEVIGEEWQDERKEGPPFFVPENLRLQAFP